MAVGLNEAGNAIIYRSVPWCGSPFSLKVRSFPKGSVPAHLKSYLFAPGGVPAACARDTANKAGSSRIHAMNACVSRQLKRG